MYRLYLEGYIRKYDTCSWGQLCTMSFSLLPFLILEFYYLMYYIYAKIIN